MSAQLILSPHRRAGARPAEVGIDDRLFELVADLVHAGTGAGLVEIAARRAARTDRSNHLVTGLDDDTSAKQQQMRQLGE